MNTLWLDEPPMYVDRRYEKIPKIESWRITETVDYQRLDQLRRMKTYDMFGDVDPAVISEKSCLSVVQVNTIGEVVGHISLCNYPNIPSISSESWIEWISRHYGIPDLTERNTLFVHMLLWDVRYNETFYKRILNSVFISNIHATRVIIVMPPSVTPVGFVEEHMTRIVPNGQSDSYRIQALYLSLRHEHCPRLRIRRVVEEDNDDVISILDRESERFKELYGEFYISEMMRYPDGIRQLIVAEADDGLATGVLCLNKIVDVRSLNRYFELGPYHGLRKYPMGDEIHHENETRFVHSDILFPVNEMEKKDRFKIKPVSKTSTFRSTEEIDEDSSDKDKAEPEFSCTDDGDVCNEDYSDAMCSSCEETRRNFVLNKISVDVGTETRGFRGSTSSLESIEKTIEKSIFISRIEPGIDDEDDNFNENVTNDVAKAKIEAQENLYQQKIRVSMSDVVTSESEKTSLLSEISGSENSDVGEKSSTTIPSRVRLSVNPGDDFIAEDVAVEIKPGKTIHRDIKIPVHHGQINAFTLELFSMKEDVDERLSYDYLEAVFECFPEHDYCVVLIPPFFPTFPLLQSFVRVPLRFNKDYPMVLYLAHRATVIGELKTRAANFADVASAEELLTDISGRNEILNDFEFALKKNSPYLAYVFLCQGAIVGLAVLCVEYEIEFIRSHYQIDDFVTFDRTPVDSHARIIHLTVMPIFASFHRYFFQELMHLSDKRALYYRLYHKEASALTRAESLATFLGEMIPVLPRRELKYCLNNYTENLPTNFVLQKSRNNFALYMMVPRVANISKIDVNFRVVVVGASDCGLAVLESLVFGPNASSVCMTNITLISPNGIPFENRPDDVEKNELPFGGRYSRDYRHLVGTRAWINVVHGTVNAILRKDKLVTVSNMGSLSYDYLVLTCGLQYQRPKFVEELRAEKRGELRDYPYPENCLTINTARDAANCLEYCGRVFAGNTSCSVIFYGRNIDCYSALAMLINSGLVPAGNITLVEPAVKLCEPRNEIFFGNDEIGEAVLKAIKDSGVLFMSGWDLVDWNLDKEAEDFFVKSITLEGKGDRRELICDVFFTFREKTINMDTFMAICRSGLVFDGSLVIDPEFHTNDPCIFAAGTITKYSRRFYADESSHRYHNPCEVGERLGQKLRNIIDPKCAKEDISPPPISKLDMTLPVFKKPIVTSSRLPGGYSYLDVRKPGKSFEDDSNDVVLITGYPGSAIGYFRLHLNQFDAVETITCLSEKDFEIENYISLYGKHQALLNNLKIRFQKSMVPDLFAYFREPWAVALFLDRFECLRVENRATLLSSTVASGDTLIQDCVKALVKSEWNAMKPEDRELIEARYAGSVYQEELENSLVDFLQYFEAQLPMYCNSRFLRQFLHDRELVQDDPLFRKINSSTR